MSDLAAALFTGLSALFTADTGSGGLNESSDTSSARVRHFVRRGDPNYEVDHPGNWPMVVCDINVTEARVFANRRTDAIIRMHLYAQRDSGTSDLTIQNGASGRITELFDGAQMASQVFRQTSTVTFTILNELRNFQAPSSGTQLHHVFEFSVIAEVTAGV